MSFQSLSPRALQRVLVELGLVGAMLGVVYLWRQGLRAIAQSHTSVLGSVPVVGGFASGFIFLAGLIVFIAAYASIRDVPVAFRLPDRTNRSAFVVAGFVPLALVALTKLVGVQTGVPYGTLTKTSYATDAALAPILLILGLAVVIGVPTLVLICQVLVQGTLRQVFDGTATFILTAVFTGVAMMSTTGGFALAPDLGKLVGTLLFVLAFGVALYATARTQRASIRYLAYLPLVFLAVVVLVPGINATDSVAEGLFTLTHLAVFAIAAYTYEWSDSLLPPAVAYLSLTLANYAVVLGFETRLLF
ncbi:MULTISPECIES: hypothetical protein [unclassified Haladaptatus]|uniref:hypothetical protein n=1 Tax=unclassified Haladaptatus TaxID=2622732 RepID=UPI0023E7F922|nr:MULTISPECIES: hypothetical protein [unclassified Haladaptatus]